MAVNLSGTFKKDTRIHNGLESIAAELRDEPHERHVIVGVVETRKLTTDIEDGGTETITVGLIHVEPLADAAAQAGRDLLAAAYKARTGDVPQPTLFEGAAGEQDEPTDRE